jgi:hypothetical protein
MVLTEQQQKSQELVNSLITHSWEDTSFKNRLVANPVSAIEEFTGKKMNIPAGKTLVVNDLTDEGYAYITIPAKPDFDSLELSDEQLEMVAGGLSPIIVSTIAAFTLGMNLMDRYLD